MCYLQHFPTEEELSCVLTNLAERYGVYGGLVGHGVDKARVLGLTGDTGSL